MICAISGNETKCPVVSAKGGFIFDKDTILKHLIISGGKCPKSGIELTQADLIDVQITPASHLTRSNRSQYSGSNYSRDSDDQLFDSIRSISTVSVEAEITSRKQSPVNVDIELLTKRKKSSSFLMAPVDFTNCIPPPVSPYKTFKCSANKLARYTLKILKEEHVQIVAADPVQELYTFVDKLCVITIQFVNTHIEHDNESTMAVYSRSVYHLSKFQEKMVYALCDKVAKKFSI